jgi:hypothetical protein
MASDDPIPCAVFAKKNNLLDIPGWKQFRKYVNNSTTIINSITTDQILQTKYTIKYQFGYQIPCNYEDAVEIDKRNGNALWQDATKLELIKINEYNTFKDKGKS